MRALSSGFSVTIRCGGKGREPTRSLDSRLFPGDSGSAESMRQNPAASSNYSISTSFSEFPRHHSFLHPAPSLIGRSRGPFWVPGKLDAPSFRRDISDGQTRRTFKVGNADLFDLSSTHRKNLCKRTSQRLPRLGGGCWANRITSWCSAPDTRRRGFGSHLRHGEGGRSRFCCGGGFLEAFAAPLLSSVGSVFPCVVRRGLFTGAWNFLALSLSWSATWCSPARASISRLRRLAGCGMVWVRIFSVKLVPCWTKVAVIASTSQSLSTPMQPTLPEAHHLQRESKAGTSTSSGIRSSKYFKAATKFVRSSLSST